ncbi:hypothetical protein FHETE_78 [Fusarium heterosporum]|uniref:Uncharacterized protein n=1 Tax=Fusarium heterosporum TaxID=42747 RepID=A0A8H5WZ51_FUSHE|nr:hypothetical protein FHETE_78 [Fusarium heterosporum]
MAGPLPPGAMPHSVPTLLHQRPQAPQSGPAIPTRNNAPAGFPVFVPANTQPYHHHPTPPMNMHRQDAAQVQDIRSREPQMYRALRLEKLPSASNSGRGRDGKSDWEEVIRTDSGLSQSMIRDRIEELQNDVRSVSKKKQEKSETLQRQIDKAQADLTSEDHDIRFYYKLAQLESQWRRVDDRRHKDDRSVRSTKKHSRHSKRSKSPKMERVAVIVYFKRTPTDVRHDLRPVEARVPMRQSRQSQQPYTAQPRTGGSPPGPLPQGFAHPAPAAPIIPRPSTVDPRLNGQPQPVAGQQPGRPEPQAQPPRQGTFNNVQKSTMLPMKQGGAVPHTAGIARPAPPPGPPLPNQFPIRPPHIQGQLPVQNAMPNMASPDTGVSKGTFEPGNMPQKKIVLETNPSTGDDGKAYYDSDEESSSLSDEGSEDESEDTGPSSVNSDGVSPQRGRGRSPGQMYSVPRGNVVIQNPRHNRKDTKLVFDHHAPKPVHPQQVRFNPPDYRYTESSRSPRREHRSHHRHEESRRVEPPRIIQAPRQSVRHVPAPPARRETFDRRASRDDKPLERARFDDTHRERDIRRDNDRFTHLEEDVRRRRESRDRRDSRREHDHEYLESESRWSDQRARNYMRPKESHHSTRSHEGRGVNRGYID